MTAATTADTASPLQARARRLRSQAATLGPILADAYRRRAAELDVQAWLEAVWNPPIDLRFAPATVVNLRRPVIRSTAGG